MPTVIYFEGDFRVTVREAAEQVSEAFNGADGRRALTLTARDDDVVFYINPVRIAFWRSEQGPPLP